MSSWHVLERMNCMFFKKSPNGNPSDLDTPTTVIGEGTKIEAAMLSGDRTVHINGYYKGTIDINSSLVLGDTGVIIGDVTAKYFLVAGEVTGNILCSSQVHLASTARIYGDVVALSMIVDEGAKISGRYIVGDNLSNSNVVEGIGSDVKYINNIDQDDEDDEDDDE